MRNYLLSLDIGTSSIGHVVFEVDENGQPISIMDLGVRVFPESRTNDRKLEPLNVERRSARGLRRNRDRGQNRIRRLVGELIDAGLLPADENERRQVFVDINPYEARAKAVRGKVSAHMLARALFHLARRRGYKSNRLVEEEDNTDYKKMISGLRKELGDRFLGEHLWEKEQRNRALREQGKPIAQEPLRFVSGKTQHYADRQMYLDEFAQIRKIQGNDLLSDAQWDALQETIFFQYPLRPVERGKCRFFPEEKRTWKDLPIAHEWRIEQKINLLRYTSAGRLCHLDDRQRSYIRDKLATTKKSALSALRNLRDENGNHLFPSGAVFNIESGDAREKSLVGNLTMIRLSETEYLGDAIHKMDSNRINDLVQFLIEPIEFNGDERVVMSPDAVRQKLATDFPELTDDQITALSTMRFSRDTSRVSRKFMERIVPILRELGCTYDKAVQLVETDTGESLSHTRPRISKDDLLTELPYYGEVLQDAVWGEEPALDKDKSPDERDDNAYRFGKIGNPSVHVALNQLRVVVNRIIDKFGAPGKIHVELTRQLKSSRDRRLSDMARNAKNEKENARIKKELAKLGIARPDRKAIQKYKLWEELGEPGSRCCVFSGENISPSMLFSDDGGIEIEHIVPLKRCYDDGMVNKTLATKSANARKADRTPYKAFIDNRSEYDAILRRALEAFGPGPKYERFQKGAFERFYGGEKGHMIARQLGDTAFITKMAAQYLAVLCGDDNVLRVSGRLTGVLRKVWDLNQFKDKSTGHFRDDHRHHIVDAFVVGLTTRSLIQRLSSTRSHRQQSAKGSHRVFADTGREHRDKASEETARAKTEYCCAVL